MLRASISDANNAQKKYKKMMSKMNKRRSYSQLGEIFLGRIKNWKKKKSKYNMKVVIIAALTALDLSNRSTSKFPCK